MANLFTVTDQVYTIADLFSERECDDWIAQSESRGYELATINSESGPQNQPDRRNNSRVILDDERLARELWERIASDVPVVMKGWQAVGLNERLRYYRYDVGQKFSWHADGCVRRGKDDQSMLTFMIYLNDDFVGGETLFRQGVRVEPQKGMVLLFTHWQKHMGNEVREGRKYVLRSDVMHHRARD